jgi:DNA-binding transcriptional LysR family regulator
MRVSKRFLPSLSSLRCLEATERLGTATAAADELALTHSAVSRQLKVLEDQLGVQLFVRRGKSLALTPAGATYARSVRSYLQDLSQASLQLKASGSKSTINLAALPSFAMYWLAPKLARFQEANQDIFVNQYTRLEPFDFFRAEVDAAIHYGQKDWQNVEYLKLSKDRIIPAASPAILSKPPISPRDLLKARLLHIDTRPGAWEYWFAKHDIEAHRIRGPLFDQYLTMANAAVLHQGIALLPDFVAEHEFNLGRLVAAAQDYVETEGNYYLVWPSNRPVSESLACFIQFLSGELKV